MKFTSSEQLKEYREKAQKVISDNAENEIRIIVGMGTCGIAAGARDVMDTILEEVENRNLQVNVIQTGCIGMCEQEPLVDVQRPGEDRIT
ncbi:MAG TPA: 2Fe-2S ferredoxin, partial [Peptococcaceae bacterium]|nr:2Fe-2S ferredoxin [Peptococcaceae bacterium]